MKHKLLKPIVTNEKLIAYIALFLAVFVFGFWRIFLFNSQMSLKDNFKQTTTNLGTSVSEISPNQTTIQSNNYKIPILMYHHIGILPENADRLKKNLTVSPENFELQVAWLKSQGYESLTLNNLLEKIKNKTALPEKPLIFTFDDGYNDTLSNAPQILKKYGFTGDFAIITQFVGISLGDNSYATWQDIRKANALGMEIISHTQDHFDGTDKKYNDTFISTNLKNSQKDINDNLGKTFPILIYPYGHYNDKYIRLAKDAGFEMGITTHERQQIFANKLMEIPRIRVNGGGSLESFKRILENLK